MRALIVISPVLFAAAVANSAAAQPETRGPYTVGTFDPGDVMVAGVSIPAVVYYPTDLMGLVPVVLVSHGYNRNGNVMVEMGQTLASRGMVAIVPSMPCTVLGGCNHVANADQISALILWAIDQSANDATSPIYGRVDATKRGAIGHSWGGLAVMLAAARDPDLDSVLMLDPNDDQRAGQMAAPNATMPTAEIMAETRGACNSTDWGNSVYPMTPAPHMRVRVKGSGHCDAEEPSDNFCPAICGRGDPALSAVFRRYAVAWTACILQADVAMAPYIGGAELDQDTMNGVLDQVDHAGLDTLPCRSGMPPPPPPPPPPPMDAGVVEDTGSAVEPDAGMMSMPEDAAAPAEDATPGAPLPPPPDAGVHADATPMINTGAQAEGCVCVNGNARASPLALLLVALVALGSLVDFRRAVLSVHRERAQEGGPRPRI